MEKRLYRQGNNERKRLLILLFLRVQLTRKGGLRVSERHRLTINRINEVLETEELIKERHRHRYEFNNDYRERIEAAGMRISGTSPDDLLVETVEVPGHKWFVGVQYHPEFKSRPNRPHPLFYEFVKHAIN